eukprot:340452_1
MDEDGLTTNFKFKLTWDHISNAISHLLYRKVALLFIGTITPKKYETITSENVDKIMNALIGKKIAQQEINYIRKIIQKALNFEREINDNTRWDAHDLLHVIVREDMVGDDHLFSGWSNNMLYDIQC